MLVCGGPQALTPRARLATLVAGERGLRDDCRPMVALAGPVVLAELGWMSMGLVDTIMVSRLGPEAIGAVGLGGVIFMAIAVFGMGLLLGLDTLVAQAYGARRLDECHRWLLHGVVLGLLVSIPTTIIVGSGASLLGRLGVQSDVLALAVPYLRIVNWSLVPLLLYAAFRRYLQGIAVVRPIMLALVSANLINAAANWVLVFGHLGAPKLGVSGSAWATCAARIYMAAFLLVAILVHDRGESTGVWRLKNFDPWRIGRIFTLGAPAAGQLTLEIGVFALATALAARLQPVALAAHQIAINIAALSFMVPLGIASAAAVTVGHAVGRRDPEGVRRAGWTALLLGVACSSAAALAFLTVPRLLLGIFTTDETVLGIGGTLLLVAALFQLFDGLQVVATGALRGLGDTRTAMLWNVAGHWLFGLPLGYFLCFRQGWGVVGLWVGLSVGLTTVGIVLLIVWARKARSDYA